MDRLVREGREFDRHYVQPVCTPTRTALMSGRCPGRFGRQTLLPSNLRAMPLGTLPHSPFNSENDRLCGPRSTGR